MNTIEFRVWNPTTKKMVYNTADTNLNNGVVAEVIKGQLMVSYQDETGSWKKTDLELFTGFFDKNKKKIYFGDKVRFMDDEYEVYLNNFMRVAVLDSDAGQINLASCYNLVEVIGHIHEEVEGDEN